MDETERLIEQWRPAALWAARLVAWKYRTTKQEQADLVADALTALWHVIRRGSLNTASRPQLVVTMICREMVSAIKTWRPDAYISGGRGQGKFWRTWPVLSFTDWAALGLRNGRQPAAREQEAPFRRVEIMATILVCADLNRMERQSLVGFLRGEFQHETGHRLGCPRWVVSWAYRSACAKLRKAGCEQRLTLALV